MSNILQELVLLCRIQFPALSINCANINRIYVAHMTKTVRTLDETKGMIMTGLGLTTSRTMVYINNTHYGTTHAIKRYFYPNWMTRGIDAIFTILAIEHKTKHLTVDCKLMRVSNIVTHDCDRKNSG